jgi:peptidyl-prolyl cis-trans isomerase SurA
MKKSELFKGVDAKVQILKPKYLPVFIVGVVSLLIAACGGPTSNGPTGTDGGETAATVNGRPIKMEEVERALKQQAQGQETQLSPLELAGARLQVLQSLIEQEVMFQKAEKEASVPTEEEVRAEYNKRKTDSRLSVEEWDAKLKEVGETEASALDAIKRGLAIQKLNDKITSRIESPNDSEIELFYTSNREAFKQKRGARLAAIVIDPRAAGEDGKVRSDVEIQTRANEIAQRIRNTDFGTLAYEYSEDSDTRLRRGEWRYFTEDQMRQAFPPGFADQVMKQMQNGDIFPSLLPFEGRFLIIKLQQKQEQDEDRTLETPGVKQEITEVLINSRKQLLAASYQAISMNEAKIENLLAKKVVENPNELSGARPAGTATPETANSNTAPANNGAAANGNASAANSGSNTTSNQPAANDGK